MKCALAASPLPAARPNSVGVLSIECRFFYRVNHLRSSPVKNKTAALGLLSQALPRSLLWDEDVQKDAP